MDVAETVPRRELGEDVLEGEGRGGGGVSGAGSREVEADEVRGDAEVLLGVGKVGVQGDVSIIGVRGDAAFGNAPTGEPVQNCAEEEGLGPGGGGAEVGDGVEPIGVPIADGGENVQGAVGGQAGPGVVGDAGRDDPGGGADGVVDVLGLTGVREGETGGRGPVVAVDDHGEGGDWRDVAGARDLRLEDEVDFDVAPGLSEGNAGGGGDWSPGHGDLAVVAGGRRGVAVVPRESVEVSVRHLRLRPRVNGGDHAIVALADGGEGGGGGHGGAGVVVERDGTVGHAADGGDVADAEVYEAELVEEGAVVGPPVGRLDGGVEAVVPGAFGGAREGLADRPVDAAVMEAGLVTSEAEEDALVSGGLASEAGLRISPGSSGGSEGCR